MRITGIDSGVRYRALNKRGESRVSSASSPKASFTGLNPKLAEVPLGKVVASFSWRVQNFIEMFSPIAQKNNAAMYIEDKGDMMSGFGRYVRVLTRTKDGKTGPRFYLGMGHFINKLALKHYDDATLKGYSQEDILGFFDDALRGKKSFPDTATTGIIFPDKVYRVARPDIQPEEWEFGQFKWRGDEQTQRHFKYVQEATKVYIEDETYGRCLKQDLYREYMVPEIALLKDFAQKTGIAGLIAYVKHPAHGHCLQYITKLPEGKAKFPVDKFVMTTGPLGVHGDFNVLNMTFLSASERLMSYINKSREALGYVTFRSGNSFRPLE